MNGWYQSLHRPPLTPPDWIFGPVWTVLYIMIALSIVLFVKNRTRGTGLAPYFWIILHLLANFSWTALFFRLRSPGLALIDIVVLDISLIVMIHYFWKTSRTASILLWPYSVWVLFATYLNVAFYILNRT